LEVVCLLFYVLSILLFFVSFAHVLL